jgi:hypothetical protein
MKCTERSEERCRMCYMMEMLRSALSRAIGDRSVQVLEGLRTKFLHETCQFHIRSTCPVHLFLVVLHFYIFVPSTAWYS